MCVCLVSPSVRVSGLPLCACVWSPPLCVRVKEVVAYGALKHAKHYFGYCPVHQLNK